MTQPDPGSIPCLGAFEVHAIVGHGGMATVWRGIHAPTGVPVAIKVLDRTEQAPAAEALRAEIEAVAALSHPGILTIFDHGVVDRVAADASEGALTAGRPWLAMELTTSGTLSRAAQAFTWREIRATLEVLLDALAHAHAHGVVHRDLKPSNVLLAGPDDLRPGLKIADFGIAAAGEDRFRQRVAGTPRYMAPEQSRGAWRDIGPWTDLYALGGLAWELATGDAPFGHGEPAELTHRHLYDTPPAFRPRTPVPAGYEAWLRRLLEKPVTARFQRAADARWALSTLEDEELAAVASRPPPAPAPRDLDTLAELLTASHHEVGGSTLTGLVAAPGEEEDDEAPTPPLAADPPPIPEDWRLEEAPEPTMQLAGAGLALFGLRKVPLVGRGAERSALWTALRTVWRTRRPQGVLLEGPAGVGKSALARWFAERADELGSAKVLVARHEAGGSAAQGLRGMLSSAIRLSGLSPERAFRRVRRWLAARGHDDLDDARALTAWLVPNDDQAPPFSSPRERVALLVRVLRAAAWRRPVVLWLDDVPWGPGAVDLAEAVLTRDEDLPVLVVMTAQAEALAETDDLRTRLTQLGGASLLTSLSITPLSDPQLRRLVRVLLPLREGLVDALVTRAAGNPLFAVQLLGDWIGRGLLTSTPEGFALANGQIPPLPDGLHEVWSARVDRVLDGPLSEGRAALEVAAALGIQVRAEEWRRAVALLGAPRPEGLPAALARARLSSPTEDGWRFAHGMLRESLVRDAVESGRWPAENAAVAAMLESLPGAEARARRGRHLLEAGRCAEAADVLLDVAAHHARMEESSVVDVLLSQASEALDRCAVPGDHPQRARWRMVQARSLRVRRRLERADQQATIVARLAQQHGDVTLRADALTERALIARARGDLHEARTRMDDALTCWRRAPDSGRAAGLAEALRHAADIAMQAGDMVGAESAIEEAATLARSTGDRTGEALAVLLRGDLARTRSDWDGARAAYEEGLQVLRAEGHRSGIADGLSGLAEVQRYTGDLDAAERGYREVARLDDSLGRDSSVSRLNLAMCLVARNRPLEALPLLEALERTWSQTGRPGYLAVLHVAILPCLAATGRWTRWRRHHDEATRLLAASGFVDVDVARQADHAGVLAAQAGRVDEARAAWEIALSQWEALGDLERADAVERALGRLHHDPDSAPGATNDFAG